MSKKPKLPDEHTEPPVALPPVPLRSDGPDPAWNQRHPNLYANVKKALKALPLYFKSNTNKNFQFNLAITAKIKLEELEQAKADMIALQLNSIGAILGAAKAKKNGCLQGFFDFEESEYILNKMSGSFEFGDLTPAVSF